MVNTYKGKLFANKKENSPLELIESIESDKSHRVGGGIFAVGDFRRSFGLDVISLEVALRQQRKDGGICIGY